MGATLCTPICFIYFLISSRLPFYLFSNAGNYAGDNVSELLHIRHIDMLSSVSQLKVAAVLTAVHASSANSVPKPSVHGFMIIEINLDVRGMQRIVG